MFWVLSITLAFATTIISASSLQLLSIDPTLDFLVENPEVSTDYSAYSCDKCTFFEVSCSEVSMNLSSEQKQVIKSLYKNGAKIVITESHIEFLSTSIQKQFIPRSFKLKSKLPGIKALNQQRLDKVSFESIKDEKERHLTILKASKFQFEKSKNKLRTLFDNDATEREMTRVEEHLEKIRRNMSAKKANKIFRDTHNKSGFANVTLAADDGASLQAHTDTNDFTNVTLAADDGASLQAHISTSDVANVTLADDDGASFNAHRKKRRFRRRYLQPKPKKKRKRKGRETQLQESQNPAAFGWNGVIKNISGDEVTIDEVNLLSKGQKFCPVELDPPVIRMQRDLDRFFRLIRINWAFKDKPDQRTELEKKFYENSSWEPPKASKELEQFISHMQQQFDSWHPPRFVKDNLTKGERNFLKQIRENNNTVYMVEDKGPSFTKMSMNQYLEAGEEELQNEKFYETINEVSPEVLKAKSDVLVDNMLMNGEIPESVAKYLKSGGDQLPKFYHLLKTHKIPCDIENPEEWMHDNGFPLRGIIAGQGGPLERLGGFVDHFLQPGMKNLPSFLQDTKHTLQILEEINEQIDAGEFSLDGVALVTLDVESMYNNMTKELARDATCQFLEGGRTEDNESSKVKSESVLEALDLCLQNNIFSFNEKLYRQKGGVGTGNKMSPPYTCLGMGKFESRALSSGFPLVELICLWKRFIDDILMLFKGSKEQCQELVDWLNSLEPGVIKFKYEFSKEKVEFLDLVISIENGKLATNLFIKPSNQQLYLDFYSNHPSPCKEGVIFGQALRVLERCSKKEDSESHLLNLKSKLLARNYPENLIESKFNMAKKNSRKSLINKKRKNKNGEDKKVRLIFTYNQSNPPLHKWVREAKKYLLKDERAKDIGKQIQICYKQPRNLRSMVTNVRKPSLSEENPGCKKCNKCSVSCPVLVEGSTFSSTNTKKTYHIKKNLNCNSSYVIYLATCKRCGGQYVGKSTTPFKKRHSNHRQEIKKVYGGLGHHYGVGKGCAYPQHFSVQLIDQVEVGNKEALAEKEVFWQNQLRCYVQNGGHAHCYRKEK